MKSPIPHDTQLLMLGVSHSTASLETLGRLYEGPHPLDGLVAKLAEPNAFGAAVVIATCNRMEIYVEAPPGAEHVKTLGKLLAAHGDLTPDDLAPYQYTHAADDALRHLFRVSAGLDSIVLGEDQILGQVKDALDRSQSADAISSTLNRALQAALRVGKHVRNETGLNEAGRSLATEGLSYFERTTGALEGRTALVIGAGSMGGVVVAALRRSGLTSIHVANRTPDKAQRLAETADGSGYSLDRIPELLAEVDIVVSCTAATEPLITAEHVARVAQRRQGRTLFLLDLSLPRNVEPAVADLPDTVLVDLQSMARDGGGDDLSAASVAAAQRIVDGEVEDFNTAQRVALATPILAAMRASAAEATVTELDRLDKRLASVDDEVRREIDKSVHRIVDKVLHLPTVRVRQLAGGPDGAVYVDALGKLFTPQTHLSEAEEAMA
jgi:glutamyl-tRNA reductase